jgi:hypothetical protein
MILTTIAAAYCTYFTSGKSVSSLASGTYSVLTSA